MKKGEGIPPYYEAVYESLFVMQDFKVLLHATMVHLLAVDELRDWCATMPDNGMECFDKEVFDACEDANVRLLSGLYGQIMKTHDALCLLNEVKCKELDCIDEDEDEEEVDVMDQLREPDKEERQEEEERDYVWWLYSAGGCLANLMNELETTCSKIMVAAGKLQRVGRGGEPVDFGSYEITRYGDPNVVLLCHLWKRTEACFTYLGYSNGLDWADDFEPGDDVWD